MNTKLALTLIVIATTLGAYVAACDLSPHDLVRLVSGG
jgi:hypothetical protein